MCTVLDKRHDDDGGAWEEDGSGAWEEDAWDDCCWVSAGWTICAGKVCPLVTPPAGYKRVIVCI